MNVEMSVETWSWKAEKQETILLKPNDILEICGMCTFERMCYHDIVINNGKAKRFCSDEIVRILYESKSCVPERCYNRHVFNLN